MFVEAEKKLGVFLQNRIFLLEQMGLIQSLFCLCNEIVEKFYHAFQKGIQAYKRKNGWKSSQPFSSLQFFLHIKQVIFPLERLTHWRVCLHVIFLLAEESGNKSHQPTPHLHPAL